MASNFQSCFFFFFIFIFICNSLTVSESALVPAMYVFGDSLVDVGNNNYLKLSTAKANFYPYGIDFPTGKPTGRFCNGKNAADFLAEKVGLPAAPPYLAVISKLDKIHTFDSGVNFGSGGAGIVSELDTIFNYKENSIALSRQVEYYASIYEALAKNLGTDGAKARAAKSLFLIEIGSNDIFGYFQSSHLRNTYTPRQYLDLMSRELEQQLKRMYEKGGRKLVLVGVGAIGCIPEMRHMNKTEGCNSALNWLSFQFNQQLISMLKRLKAQLFGFHYSYFDGFSIMLASIQKPTSFGFKEVKAACCGRGRLKAGVGCSKRADYCRNRDNHLFWDQFHPTQQAHRIFSDLIFDGSQTYTFPLNVRSLIAI